LALSVVPFGREVARANRHFLTRAVTAMARSGIGQFIDLGTGLPTRPNVHEVARSVHPDARVLYVDNDPKRQVRRCRSILIWLTTDLIADTTALQLGV
jgi:S-adenosyl methyltransferase